MTIDEEEVLRIAALAGLELDERDLPQLAGELLSILRYVQMLDELPPAAHAGASSRGEGAPPRDDRCLPSLSPEEALAAAADAVEGYFRVPPVLDE